MFLVRRIVFISCFFINKFIKLINIDIITLTILHNPLLIVFIIEESSLHNLTEMLHAKTFMMHAFNKENTASRDCIWQNEKTTQNMGDYTKSVSDQESTCFKSSIPMMWPPCSEQTRSRLCGLRSRSSSLRINAIKCRSDWALCK